HSIRQTSTETSTEFMQRFLRLAGFLGETAGTEEEQAKNFQWGLRRNSGNGRDQRNRGHQSNRSTNSGSQQSRGPSEGYSYPVCTTCGRRHQGECRRAATTCFKCGQVGHLQKDCRKNTTTSTSGQADKKPGASGRVFAITEGQAANTSGSMHVHAVRCPRSVPTLTQYTTTRVKFHSSEKRFIADVTSEASRGLHVTKQIKSSFLDVECNKAR
nr:hypothetical protein [Tanacetum cinerariifolium]